jgi:hypothetical protein
MSAHEQNAGFASHRFDATRAGLYPPQPRHVAEGCQLKTWRGGPEAGKPKFSPVTRGLLERGLMRLDTSEHWPRLFFTETGMAALRSMMTDRRLADPVKFAHIRQELGL